ncbi:3-oxoacyl-ACP synthase [Nocardiopsis sp. NRRL B-16309]|nr:3-oxoacyl-ACP synthase [Nocardiopsis sp. NRRL B-16309]
MVTAAGIGVQDSWKGVCGGRSTAARTPVLEGMPVDIACSVPAYDPNDLLGRRSTMKYDRFVQFALIAAIEAVADSGLDPRAWDGARVGVVLGCGMGGLRSYDEQHRRMRESGPEGVSPLLIPLMIPNMASGHLGMWFGARGPNFVTATACASGATALGSALDLLRRDVCDVVIAGGTEAGILPLVATGFARMGALSTRRLDDPERASRPFDTDRDGFVMGEGAGILVLERAEHARARGARVRAGLAGYGASADAHHATAPDPEGRGVALAVTAALADAGVAPDEVDHVNAHGTSTPLNDAAEAASIRRLLGDAPVVTSAKGVVGHTLGAAGAIEAALTVLAIEERTVPPTANLTAPDPAIEIDIVRDQPRTHHSRVAVSNSFGFGGQNAVLVFTEGA